MSNFSPGFQSCKASKCAVFGLWLLLGFVCLIFDDTFQPVLQEWGNSPAVGWIARYWCEIGAIWGIMAFLLVGLVSTVRHRDSTLLEFAASVSLAGFVAQLIKHTVGRVRPDSITEGTQFIGPFAWFRVDQGVRIDSFPSGHTTAAFAMATTLSLHWPRWKLLWFALASGVGVSRILTNAHYTSDVVFGSLFGTLIGLCTNQVLQLVVRGSSALLSSPSVYVTADFDEPVRTSRNDATPLKIPAHLQDKPTIRPR